MAPTDDPMDGTGGFQVPHPMDGFGGSMYPDQMYGTGGSLNPNPMEATGLPPSPRGGHMTQGPGRPVTGRPGTAAVGARPNGQSGRTGQPGQAGQTGQVRPHTATGIGGGADYSIPLWQSVDPDRIGGLLVLTSECHAKVSKDLGLERKRKPVRGFICEEEPHWAADLCIPGGGAYKLESVEKYVEQAERGGELLAATLLEARTANLLAELEAMDNTKLRNRAIATGMEESDVLAVIDEYYPMRTKAALVDIIMTAEVDGFSRIVTFEPGKLGMTIALGGYAPYIRYEVKDVSLEGQAQRQRVQLGWHVSALNGQIYTSELLQACMKGSERYTLTLNQASMAETLIRREFFAMRDDHPADVIRDFFSSLPRSRPDAIMYYAGPTDAKGRLALGWQNEREFDRKALVGPEDIMPPAGPSTDSPPGNRMVIIEGTGTARLWLPPRPRFCGLAAWEGVALFGGEGGPPLVRWLLGKSATCPEGAVLCPRPNEAGLMRMPCYQPLFWSIGDGAINVTESGPANAELWRFHIWELDKFTSPERGKQLQDVACEEVLGRGGASLLVSAMTAHASEAAAEEALMVIILRVLHRLVIHAPEDRWMGGMEEVLSCALSTVALSSCPASLYAAALSLATACAGVCESARQSAAGQHWDEVMHVLCSSLRGEHGALAAATACQLVTQVTSVHPMDHGEDAELLELLQSALIGEWEPEHIHNVQMAAAEALVVASLHCDVVKQQILENLAHSGALLPVLASEDSQVVAKVLALLRSLAAAEPREIIVQDLAPGTTEAVVDCLSRSPEDGLAQRWGLSALGAIAQASPILADVAVRSGAIDCVLWVLGADRYRERADVQIEALFCAYVLIMDEGGRAYFRRPSSRLSGLVSSILHHYLAFPTSAASEVPLWAVRTFERLTAVPGGGAQAVEPFLDSIVEAVMAPACRDTTVISAAGAISHLVAGSQVAQDRLTPLRVSLVKELQRRSSVAGAARDFQLEKDFADWAKVFVDILGGHKLNGIDENAGDPPPPRDDEPRNLIEEELRQSSKERTPSKTQAQ